MRRAEADDSELDGARRVFKHRQTIGHRGQHCAARLPEL